MRPWVFLLALFLILCGIVLFLINLGYASPQFGRELLRLWPLILIVIGLSLFWGGVIPRALAFGLTLALVFGVAALAIFLPLPL
ncbi:MAG TPA: hypothetical protein DCQ14_02305 [Firmicutes bacterium]|nr:hypothetical protein [Bacillota bacterium]